MQRLNGRNSHQRKAGMYIILHSISNPISYCYSRRETEAGTEEEKFIGMLRSIRNLSRQTQRGWFPQPGFLKRRWEVIQVSQDLSAQAGKELIKLKGKPGKDHLHRNWIWIHVELASSHQSRDAFEDLSNINSGREKTCCSHLVWSQSPCNAGARAELPSVGPAGLQVTALHRKPCDLPNVWSRNAMGSKISMAAEEGNTYRRHLDNPPEHPLAPGTRSLQGVKLEVATTTSSNTRQTPTVYKLRILRQEMGGTFLL